MKITSTSRSLIRQSLMPFAALLFIMTTLSVRESNGQTINLGDAASFAVLGASTVTNTGPTVIYGDVGVAAGTAITGFPPGIVNGGTFHSNDILANQAQTDAEIAFNYINTFGLIDLTGQDLGGQTLTAGAYYFDTSAGLTGTLTLDGGGDPNALFIFRIGTTLTTASNSSIVLTNGADASGAYFAVGSSATLGTNSLFVGTIIADQSITATTGSDIDQGRLIALNGAVTLDSNNISVVPEPGSATLVMAGVLAVFFGRRKREMVV